MANKRVENKKSQLDHQETHSRPVFREKPEYLGPCSSRDLVFEIKPHYPKIWKILFCKEGEEHTDKYITEDISEYFRAYNDRSHIGMRTVAYHGSY
jgi:hypothetical protein